MAFIRKSKLKIIIFITLLISLSVCIYAIKNYSSNSSGSTINSSQRFTQGNVKSPSGNSAQNAPFNSTNGNNKGSRNMGPDNRGNNQGSMHSGNGENWQGGMGRGINGNTNRNSNNNIKYNTFLVIYSTLFAGLCVLAYLLNKHNKIKINSTNLKFLIFALLSIGLLLRIAAAALTSGYTLDLNLFQNWALSASKNLAGFYSNSASSDYPPLYVYILGLIGKIAGTNLLNPYFNLLLRMPSIFADIASSYIIYRLAKKYLSQEMSILLSAFYVFNPAVFVNSTLWGQVDSFFTLIIICSFYFISEKKTAIGSAFLAAAVLMKPQGIIFTPVLFFELVREKNVRILLKSALAAVITAIMIVLPFAFSNGPLWIFKLYFNTAGEYPYASVNAFNFFSLIGANYKNDSSTLFLLSYHTWGLIFIILITLFSWYIYFKGNNRIYSYASALLLISGVFTFSVRMHERYSFSALSLAILSFIYLKDKRLLFASLGLSTTIFINTYYILYKASSSMGNIISSPITIITSLLNVLTFIYISKVFFDTAVKKDAKFISKQNTAIPK